jgi:hypothetical protein
VFKVGRVNLRCWTLAKVDGRGQGDWGVTEQISSLCRHLNQGNGEKLEVVVVSLCSSDGDGGGMQPWTVPIRKEVRRLGSAQLRTVAFNA